MDDLEDRFTKALEEEGKGLKKTPGEDEWVNGRPVFDEEERRSTLWLSAAPMTTNGIQKKHPTDNHLTGQNLLG